MYHVGRQVKHNRKVMCLSTHFTGVKGVRRDSIMKKRKRRKKRVRCTYKYQIREHSQHVRVGNMLDDLGDVHNHFLFLEKRCNKYLEGCRGSLCGADVSPSSEGRLL